MSGQVSGEKSGSSRSSGDAVSDMGMGMQSEGSAADSASAESATERSRGKVKWFNDAKGFGFIEHTTGKDVFVHFSSIEADGFKTLKDGDEVEYEMKEGPKGFHAVRVSKVRGASSETQSRTEDQRSSAPSEGEDESQEQQ